MEVANTRKLRKYFEARDNVEGVNQLIEKYISDPIQEDGIVFEDRRTLENMADDLYQTMQEQEEFTRDNAILAAMLMAVIADEIDEDVIAQHVLSDGLVLYSLLRESRVFHKEELEGNPYIKNIRFEERQVGSVRMKTDTYMKYELIEFAGPCDTGVFALPSIGTFDFRFRFPMVEVGEEDWYGVTPYQMVTMEEPIQNAHGKVLVLGLGIGYFSYMVSEKEDVQEVTVIENNPDIIEMFQTYILPQFANKEKIKIIQADAFSYINHLEDGIFDYCFADIWLGTCELDIYIKMCECCNKFQAMTVAYWMENEMLDILNRLIYCYMWDALHLSMKDLDDTFPFGKGMEKDIPEVAVILKEKLKNVVIRKIDDAEALLNREAIKDLISGRLHFEKPVKEGEKIIQLADYR